MEPTPREPELNYVPMGLSEPPLSGSENAEVNSTPTNNTNPPPAATPTSFHTHNGTDSPFLQMIRMGSGANSAHMDPNQGLWMGAEAFSAAPFRVDMAGNLVATSATITIATLGGFDIGADYIRDAANSFGLASTVSGGDDVRFWAGDTYANRATAAFRVAESGAVTATNFTFTGGNVGSAVVVAIGSLNVAARGWTQTSIFSVTDADTVAWAAGTFTSADGTSYSIAAGDTGDMAAATYIYLDTAVSTTAYQSTTTAATAVGAGKVLIAKAQNGTTEATFQVFGGIGGTNIDASSIVANSITANELSTSILYAGSIEIDTVGNIRSGQTSYNTGDGWWLGNDGGTPKFSIGNTSGGTSYATLAYDAVSNGGEDSGVSSSTHAHTCTGTNLVLLVFISSTDSSLTDRTVSSVTYNGVACTRIQSNDNADIRHSEIWALTSPTTGANNIIVTMGGTCTTLTVSGLSITGAGSIITSGGVSLPGSVVSSSTTLTSLVANSWLIGMLHTSAGGSSYTEGAGQTNRFTQAGTNIDMQVSTKPLVSAGASSISWTWTGTAWKALSALIIEPKATVTYTGNGMTWDGTSLTIRGATTDVQTFTSSGTWTKPAFGSLVFVQAWGGGGGGAEGGITVGGGGGGGGAYREYWFPISSLGATETVTLGDGGAARSAGSTGAGNAGGNTTFGSLLTVYGGAGGGGTSQHCGGGGGGGSASAGSQSGSGATGGNGGSPSMATITGGFGKGGIPTVAGINNDSGGGGGGGGDTNTGQQGGDAVSGGGGGAGGPSSGSVAVTARGGNSVYGGAGGGAGAAGTAGGPGGTSQFGGNGGAGAYDANNATAGSQPGGGGGGSETGASGAGGKGKVIVTTV